MMRCRECAAEVAVAARVCSRCGAPITGQPPVVVDTVVADTGVGVVSDTAGKAVPAGVAGHAPPEPYVPGSGARFPGKLRLVLAGYAGIACGLFAGALFWAAYAVFLFFFVFVDGDEPESVVGVLVFLVCAFGSAAGGVQSAQGAYPIFQAAPAAQRSTHGHGDGLEAWRTRTDTRHSAGRHRPRVPVAFRGASRVMAEGRHAGAR
jgi:hypothetical protein